MMEVSTSTNGDSCETDRSCEQWMLALAERIFAAHEIIGRRAERRIVVITETDYALE